MMRSAKKTYEIDMLHGAILPKLLRFAVPLTLSTMLQLLFNAAEGSVFQNQQLRQALAGIARESADVPSSGLYTAAKGLVPEGLTVDGLDYRETAGDPLPAIPEPKALYLAARQGMATSDFRRDPAAAQERRTERAGRPDQQRMAEGVLPVLLGGRGRAGRV